MKSEKAHEVPEGYFAQLEQDLLKIPSQTPAKRGVVRTLWTPFTKVAAAAAVALVMGLGLWGSFSSPSSTYDLAELSDEEISEYLEGDLANLPSSLLTEQIGDETLEWEMDSEVLEMYLEEETTEYDLLMEWEEI
jgi:hypothetical protein